MPAGYYQVPGVPYPRVPTDPNRNRDLLGNVIDPAMEPDLGPRTADPATRAAMERLSAPAAAPAQPPAPTVLQPSRTSPFTRSDAQSLLGLDERALAEAQAIAANPVSTPSKMTATFGGKSYEMQPSARVDRNVLAGVYNKYLGKQQQERQDAVRAQEQSGRERIVSIPGQQGIEKRKLELGTEERMAGADREFKTPTRDADIAAKGAATAAVQGAERRAEVEFGEGKTPETRSADELYERITTGPFANTPQAKAAARAIFPRTSYASGLDAGQAAAAAEGAAPQSPSADAIAQIAADPAIAALIERAKGTQPGFFTGSAGRATGAAARRVAANTIASRLRAQGVPENEIQDYITSALGPEQQTAGTSFARPAGAMMRALPFGGSIAANAIDAAGAMR